MDANEKKSLDEVTVNPIQLPVGARLVSTTINSDLSQNHLEMPQVKPQAVNLSLLNKIKSFTIAMVSKALQPEVSRKQRNLRLAVCKSCPSFEPTKDKGVGFCKSCGCGKHKMSTLAFKSRIVANTCPKKLWDLPSV